MCCVFRITVDLSTGRDLAFHFNPRFNESGRQVIVRNSCIGGQWGAEERELRHFPFFPGQPFEVRHIFALLLTIRPCLLDTQASEGQWMHRDISLCFCHYSWRSIAQTASLRWPWTMLTCWRTSTGSPTWGPSIPSASTTTSACPMLTWNFTESEPRRVCRRARLNAGFSGQMQMSSNCSLDYAISHLVISESGV